MPLVSTGRRRRARDPAINKQRNGHAREHTNKRWLIGRGGREQTDERANKQANKPSKQTNKANKQTSEAKRHARERAGRADRTKRTERPSEGTWKLRNRTFVKAVQAAKAAKAAKACAFCRVRRDRRTRPSSDPKDS